MRQPLAKTTKSEFGRADATARKWAAVARVARYRLGVALLDIQDRKLWREGGFRSFSAYLESLRGPGVRSMQRYMTLAWNVDIKVATAVDAERIEHALVLLPQAPGKVQAITLRTIRALKVEVERDEEIRSVAFDDATTEELSAAAERVRQGRALALPPAYEKVRGEVAAAIDAGAGSLGDVHIRRRGRKSVIVIEVPIERSAELLGRLKR